MSNFKRTGAVEKGSFGAIGQNHVYALAKTASLLMSWETSIIAQGSPIASQERAVTKINAGE